MRNIGSAAVLVLALTALIFAAENVKQVDAILKTFSDAVEKADQARAKSVDKAADAAIGQLTKFAGKAKSDKDQISEINAWKTVLKLDESHAKARKYFSDLGQLDQVLQEVAVEGQLVSKPPALIGKWSIRYSDKAVASLTIHPDSSGEYAVHNDNQNRSPVPCLLVTEGNSFIVNMPQANVTERWTRAGSKFFVEHWHPSSRFGDGEELTVFAYAVKDQ